MMLFPFSTDQGVHDLPCILIFWVLIVHTIKSRTADITLNKATDIRADNNFYERQPIDRTLERSPRLILADTRCLSETNRALVSYHRLSRKAVQTLFAAT